MKNLASIFSTVSAALLGVSTDCLKFYVSERNGRTCSLVRIHEKNKKMVV